jgi:hypothetical protein
MTQPTAAFHNSANAPKKQKRRMASEAIEVKVQEKQQWATHENKTKCDLARDTDVWKNPNSYQHLPSRLQLSSTQRQRRQRTNCSLPSSLAAKSKTPVV